MELVVTIPYFRFPAELIRLKMAGKEGKLDKLTTFAAKFNVIYE